MANINWNASNYKENFSFVPAYGEAVLDLLTKPKGSCIVDLGCGNGILTKKLFERGYQVVGIDDSAEMIAQAKVDCPNIEFITGNALDFVLEHKADAIFSNAVFHWIDEQKQQKMLCNIFNQLNEGGELVCEFGGAGCAEHVHRTLEQCFLEHGFEYKRVFYFPTIGQYAPMLEKAGFRIEYALLFDRPTVQKGEDGLADWIKMFVKKPFEGIDKDIQNEIICEAVNRLKSVLYINGEWIVDYVRIRFRAVKNKDKVFDIN